MKVIKTDYCIVGAGYSGLAAAYRLLQAGSSVVVLEARDRVGGRVWSHQMNDGTSFEIGGQWVSEWTAQPHVRNLMQQLSGDLRKPIGIYKQYKKGMNVFINADGQATPYNAEAPLLDGLPPISAEGKAELGAIILVLEQMAAVINTETPWEHVLFLADIVSLTDGPVSTTAADEMTIADFIEKNIEHKDAKAVLNVAMCNIFCTATDQVSLLHLLFMIKTFGGKFLNITGSGENQAERFRIHGGTQQVAKYIAAKLGSNLYLESPVYKITTTEDKVWIESAKVNVQASRVIIAVPIGLTGNITFNPSLPSKRIQLQKHFHAGIISKIWLVYDTPFWRKKGYAGQEEGLSGETISIRTSDYVLTTLDCSEEGTKAGLLAAFIAGPKAEAFQQFSRKKRKAIVLDDLANRFGEPARNLSNTIKFLPADPQNPVKDSYFEWNWSITEWTEGACAGVPGPRVYTAGGTHLRQPVNRIHWAGVDTAVLPYATISGAIQTGERAATEVLLAEK